MYKLLFIGLIMALLSACSATPGPQFSEPEIAPDDKSQVYFYRPKAFYISMRDLNVYINDNPIHVLSNGTYQKSTIDPGVYKFSAKIKGEPAAALRGEVPEFIYEVKPGETYYIGWYPSRSLYDGVHNEFFIASNQIASEYIKLEDMVGMSTSLGVVSEGNGLVEISKTRLSNCVIDPNKI